MKQKHFRKSISNRIDYPLVRNTGFLLALAVGLSTCSPSPTKSQDDQPDDGQSVNSGSDAANKTHGLESATKPQAEANSSAVIQVDVGPKTRPDFTAAEFSAIPTLAISGASSLVFYEETLYPILSGQKQFADAQGVMKSATCSLCHAAVVAPFFAVSDAAKSYDALLGTGKIDLEAPEKSRVFLKVSADGHNCWSDCTADGEKILAAIKDWSTKEKEAGKGSTTTNGLITSALLFTDAKQDTGNGAKAAVPGLYAMEAEAGTLAGAMVVLNNTNALGGKGVYTPNGQAVANQQAADASADRLTYTFDVKEAGLYYLFVRASAPTGADDSYHFKIDNGAFANSSAIQTMNMDTYSWSRSNLNNGAAPFPGVQLAAGAHTVEIRRREDGFILDALALSTDANFAGTDTVATQAATVLTYDIGTVCKSPGSKLTIEVADHNAGEAYRFANPTITAGEKGIQVNGIEVRVNNARNIQYATFRLVQVSPAAGETVVASSASMIVLKEKGPAEDKFAIEFGSCTPL